MIVGTSWIASAATTAITHLLSAGDHIVSMDDVYGGTNRYFRQVAARMNIQTTFVDATDPAKLDGAIRDNTKMVWLETPTNPTLKIVDIKACADVVQKHKKDKKIFMVVDNTFLTSYFQRPLELGDFFAIEKINDAGGISLISADIPPPSGIPGHYWIGVVQTIGYISTCGNRRVS